MTAAGVRIRRAGILASFAALAVACGQESHVSACRPKHGGPAQMSQVADRRITAMPSWPYTQSLQLSWGALSQTQRSTVTLGDLAIAMARLLHDPRPQSISYGYTGDGTYVAIEHGRFVNYGNWGPGRGNWLTLRVDALTGAPKGTELTPGPPPELQVLKGRLEAMTP